MKTITAYAVVHSAGKVDTFPNEVTASYYLNDKPDGVIVKLTGEYDDTPEVSNCPFCGKQPKINKIKIFVDKTKKEVTCCNGIKTTLEEWESRV